MTLIHEESMINIIKYEHFMEYKIQLRHYLGKCSNKTDIISTKYINSNSNCPQIVYFCF